MEVDDFKSASSELPTSQSATLDDSPDGDVLEVLAQQRFVRNLKLAEQRCAEERDLVLREWINQNRELKSRINQLEEGYTFLQKLLHAERQAFTQVIGDLVEENTKLRQQLMVSEKKDSDSI